MEIETPYFVYLLALPVDIIIHEIFWYFKRPEELKTIAHLLSAGLYCSFRQEKRDGDNHPRTMISNWLQKTKAKMILQGVMIQFDSGKQLNVKNLGKLLKSYWKVKNIEDVIRMKLLSWLNAYGIIFNVKSSGKSEHYVKLIQKVKPIRKTKKQRMQKRILEEIKRQHMESLKTKHEIDEFLIEEEKESQRIELRKRRHEDIMSQFDGQLSEGELQKIEQELQRMEDHYENTFVEDENTSSEERVSNNLNGFTIISGNQETKSPLSPEFCDPRLLSSPKTPEKTPPFAFNYPNLNS